MRRPRYGGVMTRPALVLMLTAAAFACAPKCPEAPPAVAQGGTPVDPSPGSTTPPEAQPPLAAPVGAPATPAAAPAASPATKAGHAGGAEPASAGDTPAGALPEVVVENVGLHIGGGPNDDATKAPFQAAIAKRFEEFRRCYVHVEDPKKGGTFGVDLLIGRAGGKADVKQPRTGMKGSEFRDCVIGVFRAVEFDKPKKGPTMISYSLRFELKG